ncbi:hypothetical protein AOQ84DRAFT_390225 [Glonium stellatum]|uniref:Uncharacterized protein n=1 Tax=Glonium stellatum TaxID=574774 RepID=A0A8E2JR35_9PEZI|nr:hypothetical protein AOQ84DRAFT_390225 [Glonium stellatum]
MASAHYNLTSFDPKRLARSYQPVQRLNLNTDAYPCQSTSLLPSIHDPQYYQGILANSSNFSARSVCEIFEIKNGIGSSMLKLDDIGLAEYLQRCSNEPNKTILRAIFCTYKNAQITSFGLQVSLSQRSVEQLLQQFNVSPQFVPLLFAEPDYWAPGDFQTHKDNGSLESIEFFCQQPRWNIHKQQTPWCIYMTHDFLLSCSTYIIVCGEAYPSCDTVKLKLSQIFGGVDEKVAKKSYAKDPFLLHSMISYEALFEAKAIVTKLRLRLYDQLDIVDAYAKEPSDRRNLEKLTIELHSISQDTDSLLASADMAEMIAESMLVSHQRCKSVLQLADLKDEVIKISDSLTYLKTSIQSQKRWLMSYKNRKDIAMNLVYNLVTQQDSATNTTIARETKADSSSMKTIAILTMLFLPGTFIATVFQLPFVENAEPWHYLAVTLPLTVLIMAIWSIWNRILAISKIIIKWSVERLWKTEVDVTA